MKPAHWRSLMLAVASLLVTLPSQAQKRYDPLNQKEIDDLRETNQEPDKRLKLYIAYARARLVSLEEARANPKTQKRGEITHEWLTDFLDIYDELDDNVDMYVQRKDDFRKAMQSVIEADAEFQSKLLALRDAANVPIEEYKQYEFVLKNALETVDSAVDDHKKTLQNLEEEAKKKKKKKDKE
jgi:hypothetical protein